MASFLASDAAVLGLPGDFVGEVNGGLNETTLTADGANATRFKSLASANGH